MRLLLLFLSPLLFLGEGPGVRAATPAISHAESKAFGLGFTLALPTARVQRFILAVKGLEAVKGDKEQKQRIAQLAQQAQALRQSEARSYAEAAGLLATMHAPAPLRSWANGAARTLRAPLVTSEEAKPNAQSDPDTAAILSTLDEAQAIKTDADNERPVLDTWLKLSQGAGSVWAANVGGLVAGLHVSLVLHDTRHPPSPAAATLRAQAPADTPPSVLRALAALGPAGGNLAKLVPAGSAPPLSPDMMADSHDTLLDAFHARSLLGDTGAEGKS